jgi:hypothetical protein
VYGWPGHEKSREYFVAAIIGVLFFAGKETYMGTNEPITNNGGGAMEQPVPTLRVIVDLATGDEALSFDVKGFRANFSPEDLEIELMSQLHLDQMEAKLISQDICQREAVFLQDFVAFELFSEHGSFEWPDEDFE